MVSTQMAALLASLGPGGENGLSSASPDACARALGVDGIGATVFPRSSGGALVWHAGPASTALDALQFQLGQGPGVDAAATGELVLAPDLADGPVARWPAFTPAALELGVHATFAFPLRIGGIALGVVLAYREVPGSLDPAALTDGLALAEAAALALTAPAEAAGSAWLQRPTAYRAEVHQATGMV